MSHVRKTVVSNCEKKFLIKNVSELIRLDGRSCDEFRKIEIEFGKEWGSCYVSLGRTRALAQVSCEIEEPKSSRPSEGILNINIELNPIAAPYFEAGRQSELSVQLNRFLEKCLKDSKAVDLESLCIKMNEKVWAFRVDINILNHDGNILDCASIAALSALAHFRRPDVTCDGEEFIIHSYKQRDPIPTVMHHYPVCITYSIFNGGNNIIADPNLLEEGVADGFLSIGLNAYKELCGLHLGGKVDLNIDVILSTANKAATRAGYVVQFVKHAIEQNNVERQEMKETGFHKLVESKAEQSSDVTSICLDQWKNTNKSKRKEVNKNKIYSVKSQCHDDQIQSLGNESAVLIQNVTNSNSEKWQISDSEDDSAAVEVIEPVVDIVAISDSESEEETVVMLNSTKKNSKKKKLKT